MEKQGKKMDSVALALRIFSCVIWGLSTASALCVISQYGDNALYCILTIGIWIMAMIGGAILFGISRIIEKLDKKNEKTN